MSTASILKVIETWIKEYLELGAKNYVDHVLIFENKGKLY